MTINERLKILPMLIVSPYKKTPMVATPVAPMPVHTAYAVPTGRVFIEKDSNTKEIKPVRSATEAAGNFVNPLDSLRAIGQIHSKKPARNRYVQAINIFLPFLICSPIH